MTTAATAFAETTRLSNSPELRKRVLSLYRKFTRNSQTIAEIYEISYPVARIRTKIRQEFERHRYVEELSVRNILYAKGQMEYQETINYWKQQSHVLKFFLEEEAVKGKPKPSTFVEKFLQNSL